MSELIGQTLGHYRIVEKIGEGGMGEVYRARDERLDREVAIKVLPREVAADSDRVRRFEREAKAVAKLDHPNILAIHDFGSEEGVTYAVMELLEGQSLREVIREGELTPGKALEYAHAIVGGLASAHDKGIIHRDLKPENVFLTRDGRIKILDFGLAKLKVPEVDFTTESPTASLDTVPGRLIGTVPYMAPEQVRGQPADQRTDIFALGCVLYEMVTGRRAFAAESVPELLTAIIREEPKKVSELVPSLPLDLDRLVERAMRKDPGRRFHSMDDLRVEIEDVKEALDSGTFVSAKQVLKADAPRRRWLWAVAGGAAVGIAIASWLYPPSSHPSPRTVPLTSYPGMELHPAISPDGSLVAFTRVGEAGSRDLYVKLIDGGEPLLVSHGAGGDCADPAWSPDGHQIAFIRH